MITEKIIKRCANNDRVAQKELYDLLSPKMFAVCIKYMKSRESAEDMFQESFVHLFKRINQFRFEGSFEGWARKIFTHRCIEQLKKDNKKNSYEFNFREFDEIPIESQNPSMLDILKESDILKQVDKLSKGYKRVFDLHVIQGFPHSEIGKILGISESTSKTQFKRGREVLQKLVNKSNAIYQ